MTSAVQFTEVVEGLFQASKELEQQDKQELESLNLPVLIHSDLRALAENLAQKTGVKFPTKLYFRLAEILLFSFFNPDRGKHKFKERKLNEEKVNLRSILDRTKTLITTMLAYSDCAGTSVVQWDSEIASLAMYLKSGQYTATYKTEGCVIDDVSRSIEKLVNFQSNDLFSLFQELFEVLMTNFIQFKHSPLVLLQAPASLQNEALLLEVTNYLLVADFISAHFHQRLHLVYNILLLEQNMRRMEEKIREIQPPELVYRSSLERATAKAGDEAVTFVQRQRAKFEKEQLQELSGIWDEDQDKLHSITSKSLKRSFPNMNHEMIEEALFHKWISGLLDYNSRWRFRVELAGVLDYCSKGTTTGMDSLLEILEPLWYTKPIFPKGGQMNPIDAILEEKIRALNPFLKEHSDPGPPPAVSDNSSKPVTTNNCKLSVINKLVDEFLDNANKAQESETVDYFDIKVVLKQGERASANISMCRVEYNSLGGDVSMILELEQLQSNIDKQVVNLERRAAEKKRIDEEKVEIKKVKISSSRTKIGKFSGGGSPDLFLEWLDQINENFNSELYKCPLERSRKIKCFLDLKSHPDIEKVVSKINDPDKLLHFLRSTFGSEQYLIQLNTEDQTGNCFIKP